MGCRHVCIECFESLLTRLVRPDAVSLAANIPRAAESEWVYRDMISTVTAAVPRTQHGLNRPYHQKQSPSFTAKPRTRFCVVDRVYCWDIWGVKCGWWCCGLRTRWQQYETHIYMLWVQSKCVKWLEKTWIISTVSPCERWDFLIGTILFNCWSLTVCGTVKTKTDDHIGCVSNPSELPNVT